MKKALSYLLTLVLCLTFVPTVSFADTTITVTTKETFDSDAALDSFVNSGGGTEFAVVANPDSTIGGSVLMQKNNKNGSWIQSNTDIVPVGSTGIYEVGVDLYVPKEFNDNPANLLTMSINGSSGCRFRMIPENSTVQTNDPKTLIPYDEWFRAVYEFNFDAGTYSAYLLKDGVVISEIVKDTKSGVSSSGTVGVQSVRIHLGVSNFAIYMDNFSIGMPVEHIVPRMETFDSEEALENFEYAGNPIVDIVSNPDVSVGGNCLRHYNLGTTASWVRNKTTIVPANSKGIYDLGVDLYVPKEFNTSADNYIKISLCGGFDFKLVPDSVTLSGAMFNVPYDEWFRVVYEFDFNNVQYSAYIVKDDEKIAQIYKGNKIPDSVIQNGLTQLRVYLAGNIIPIYLDNFSVETVVEYDLLGCEAFDGDNALAGFDIAGNPSLSVVPNPDTTVGGSVLKHYNENTTGSWIRNKKLIVPPNYSGSCEVGVDLYVPQDFNTSTNSRMDIRLNDTNSYRIDITSENYNVGTVPGIEAKIPSDTWVRLVYELNFDKKLFNAYIMKDGKVYSILKKNGALAANILETGITTMRVFLQCGTGEKLAAYVDNFGIKNDSFGIYDFEDAQYDKTFETAGAAEWSVVADPTEESRSNVLRYTHPATCDVSWIKSITTLGGYKTGKWEVGADLYIPSDALSTVESYIRLAINDDSNHKIELIRDDISEVDWQNKQYGTFTDRGPTRTTVFPRDKWIRVRFVFDLDNNEYNVEIVCDGKIITRPIKDKAATSIKKTGLRKLQLYARGAGQTFYVDNIGISECTETEEVPVPSVNFLRIDGLNMAGEELSLYGDFVDGASVNDLTNIVWKKCYTQEGEYERIPEGDNCTSYTPKDGGYYVSASANLGIKFLETIPVYVRPAAQKITLKPYLNNDGGKLQAAVVYMNEGTAVDADIIVGVYEGDLLTDVLLEKLTIPAGNNITTVNFEKELDIEGKTVQCYIWENTSNMVAMCDAVGLSDELPLVDITSDSNGSSIALDGENIAVFAGNNTMRFRSSPDNDHWIGTEHNPSELGYGYRDESIAGFACTGVDYEAYPGAFKIAFEGLKQVPDTTQTVEFIGFWNEAANAFEFIRNSSLTAKTSSWQKKSKSGWHTGIEVFDFHVERMSSLDRVYNNNLNGDLYDYVLYYASETDLMRIPKLRLSSTSLPGTYYCDFYLSPGGKYNLADAKEGGWEATLLDTTGDAFINICYSWYDFHNQMRHIVPQNGSDEYFTAAQSWLYTPTKAEYDAALIEKGTDVPYKDLPNYQIPPFSTNNTFDRQFGGTEWEYAWWKSNYNCFMDNEIGYSDTSSVKIINGNKTTSSWYTEGGFGYPHSFDDVPGKKFRLSGWIKTENVVGEAYIANNKTGSAGTTWLKSTPVSGTNDWTYTEVEFIGGSFTTDYDNFYLTLDGTGTAWFDDVKIEQID